ISTGGSLTRLYSFPSLGNFNALGLSTNATGANPRAGLLLAADGNYYGTAYQGGANGYGTVFKMTPAGVVTALHAFGGPPFASGFPLSSISQDAAGNLYGTTESGGYLNQGTAWRISPAGQYSLLHSFAGTLLDGSKPYGTLLVVGNSLYGATFSDSVGGAGAIFKLDLGSNGALPVEFSVSTTDIDVGASATLTWSSPTASTCTTGGAWSDTVGTSGSLAVTPASAGIYTYTLTCTDGASVVRTASTAVRVKAPAAQPVDAGGSGGGGALSIPALLLLGALALRKKL
ncbi:MAG TPA: choice-of-anchor tandem repeat GloVer-containing protein, partial [Steroidobacteraceae bacterium]|nr:choice-of-anchor tandem repeat GloVer-containing protein [Steroidobacteraceae bacterium]